MEIQALTPIDKLKEKLITMTDGILGYRQVMKTENKFKRTRRTNDLSSQYS